jgi:hypothetical protein
MIPTKDNVTIQLSLKNRFEKHMLGKLRQVMIAMPKKQILK